MSKSALKLRWLLIVRDGKSADLMLHRLELRPSTTAAGEYIGFYALGALPQLLDHIARLKAVGLHGLAKKVVDRKATSRSHPRKRQADPPKPAAQIIAIMAAQQVRLQYDAQKRHREAKGLTRAAEIRRDREMLQQADAAARDALLRAKGER